MTPTVSSLRCGLLALDRTLKKPAVKVSSVQRSVLQQQRWLSSTEDKSRSLDDYFESLKIHTSFRDGVLQKAKELIGNDRELTVASLSKALGGDEAVAMLSKQIQTKRRKERKKKRANVFVSLCTHQLHPRTHTSKWMYGESLLDLVERNRSELERSLELDMEERVQGSCGGQQACSTCQVYLDEHTFNSIVSPTEQEQDMLDIAFETQRTSRLGCQVKLNDALVELANQGHDIQVTIPRGANDHWV